MHVKPLKELYNLQKEKGVDFPRGFMAAGTYCGIKRTDKDIGVLYCQYPCEWAGTFTTNMMKAAPVRLCMERKGSPVRAVIANSGCANCMTGPQGYEDAVATASIAAESLGCGAEDVLVCSTGKIGVPLDMNKIRSGINGLTALLETGRSRGRDFARAILTTDTGVKICGAECATGSGGAYRIGAAAKGAGMIEPHMATMLCFITTDAVLPGSFLQKALSQAVDMTFNRITVDGDMSTNDSVILLANGRSGVELSGRDSSDYQGFVDALTAVCSKLARDIVCDGEGATKVIVIRVKGGKNDRECARAAYAVGNSPLFKCAVYGESFNWGRVAAACGASGLDVREEDLVISIGGLCAFMKGQPLNVSSKEVKEVMTAKEISVDIEIGRGSGSFELLSSDLTHRYVDINVQ